MKYTWKEVPNGDKLEEKLKEASREYAKAGERLKEVVGEDGMIHNTFIGMKGIDKLETGEDKDKLATKLTAEFCRRLKELTVLTGDLICVHKIDFLVVQKTKEDIINKN
ncbi:hypothetical protein ACTFIW_010425 [Dictyostelium discoideum]